MQKHTAALAALLLLLAAPCLRAADADAIAALRARIDQQAAQLEELRGELARLEAETRARDAIAAAPPPPAAPAAVSAVKFGGLIQGWYAAGHGGFNDTFRIRRAELKFSGELAKTVGWLVMIDPAKSLAVSSGAVTQSSRPLQDAFITVAFPGKSTIQFGQFKVPLSREGLESTAALDTVERALFLTDRARGAGLGDVRDIGLAVRGVLNGRFDYNVGVFNGSGESQNDTDRDERKALAGRFVAAAAEGLRLGVSGAWGGPEEDGRPRRDRLGGEVLFVRAPWKLAAEVMAGRDGPLRRRGFYAHAGYRFNPRLEGIVRVDAWDPDTSSDAGLAAAGETDYIAGLNYSPMARLRLQANAVHKVFSDESVESRSLLLINLQTSW